MFLKHIDTKILHLGKKLFDKFATLFYIVNIVILIQNKYLCLYKQVGILKYSTELSRT